MMANGRWGNSAALSFDRKLEQPLYACEWRHIGSFAMTRRCELTGKLPLAGQNKSHSEMKTKRKFRPNLCSVTLMSEKLGRKFRLRVCAQGLKTVEHRGGLDGFLAKAKNADLSLDMQRLKSELTKDVAPAKAA
jgi:large subunit ribosomal protein L28